MSRVTSAARGEYREETGFVVLLLACIGGCSNTSRSVMGRDLRSLRSAMGGVR